MRDFLWGASSVASLVVAVFFLKFWASTQDRLFAMFSAAFAVLACNWLLLASTQPEDETRHFAYVARLLAFGLIAAAVIDKNRRSSQ
jgi:hypothetical protein